MIVPATSQIAVSRVVDHHRNPLSPTRSAVSMPSPSIRGTIIPRRVLAIIQPKARPSHPQRLRINITSLNITFISCLLGPARFAYRKRTSDMTLSCGSEKLVFQDFLVSTREDLSHTAEFLGIRGTGLVSE